MVIKTQSFQNDNSTLFLVATPIGNLEDITLRAINTLKSVDYIFCEDTRHSGILLNHYEIKASLDSYFEFNKEIKGERIINLLKEGHDVALISDAGTPGISDPGYEIVKLAIEEGFNVVSIPGPSAILTALVVSGLVIQPFTFLGFLPRQESKQISLLSDYKYRSETIVIYESPNRVYKTLENALDTLGDRQMVIARELTKKFETMIRGRISKILETQEELKGECVIIIEGGNPSDFFQSFSIEEHVNYYIEKGNSENDSMKLVAKDLNIKKSDVYKEYKIRRTK